jgi:gliding motility-associated-like protein
MLLSAGVPALARHIVGGVINYTYLGGTRYQVTLKVYRDCASGGPGFDGAPGEPVSEALLVVYDEVTNARVLTVSLTSPVVTSVLPTISSSCMGSTGVCVQQGVYTTTITLPDASKGYNLMYCRCCRNGTINNISAPGSTGASYYARIPPTNTYHNSNPVYALFPPIYICQNAPLVFNHSATDADGDSLFYELCNSMNGTPTSPGSPSISPVSPPSTYPGLTSVTYISPYSATDPLGSSPPPAVGLSIDPATGVLTGTPPTLGQFVCGICCHEYRGGVEISTTFRDFQFNVVTCPIPIASIPSSRIDPSSGYGTFTTNCDNFLVSFTNRSSGATSYRWDFGDLTSTSDTSHATNPTYTYPDTGMYWVTLIAYNAAGCTDTTHAWVGVYPLFFPNFDYANKCVDTAVTFRDRTTSPYSNPISWTWNFGDASTSRVQNPPPHLYSTAGTYGVSLRVTTDKGCDKTITHNVVINPLPSPSFFADTTCVGAPVYFHNTSTGRMGTYLWTFGDGDSSSAVLPTHTYTSAGYDTVYLILHSDSGCYAKTKRTINVHPIPVVTTNNDTTICPGARINMFATGGTSYNWTPGTYLSSRTSATPVATPTANINYTVQVADANRCQNFDTVHVAMYTNHPDFTFRNICKDTAAMFTDLSISSAGAIIAWNWTFGDGGTDTARNPTHLYAASGSYNVKLKIFTALGCEDSITKRITIFPIPTPSFTPDSTCINAPVYFRNTTVGAVRTYNWDFGDLGTSTLTNPSHTYTTAGTFNVQLVAHTDSGCTQYYNRSVIVYPRPTVTTSPDTTICPGSRTQIAATGGRNYYWSASSTLSNTRISNPISTPVANINYTVTVSDSNRCQSFDSVRVSLFVNRTDFNFRNICQDTAMPFTDLSTTTGGTITNWTWTFGDGGTAFTQNPSHSYAAAGTYTVKLKINTSAGCQDSTTKTVIVHPIPNPSFYPDTSCVYAPVFFHNTTTGPVATPSWDFGDLGTSTLLQPSHTFLSVATYSVVLTVRSDSGCLERATVNVPVHALPNVITSQDTFICPGSSTQIAATGGSAYWWTPTTALSNPRISNPIASPTVNIVYRVQVQDTNRCQNFDSIRVSQYVNGPNFSFRNRCQDTAMQFTDLSTTSGGTVNTWLWRFGDGTTSNLQNPSHLYSTAGTYNVTLIMSTSRGCNDSTTKAVIVYPLPSPNFTPDTSCTNHGVYFHNSSSGPINRINWTFGDGGTSTINEPTHTYTAARNYTVVLSATSDSGCTQYNTQTLTVHPLPVVITSADTFICPGSTTQIAASGGINYWWTPGATLSNTRIPNPIASPSVNTTYYIQLADSFRCQNFDSVKVSFFVNHPDFSFRNICQDTAMPFRDLSTTTGGSINGWLWRFGDGTTSNLQNPSHLYAAPGTYTVTLQMFSGLGCTDSISKQVVVQPLPIPSFVTDSTCINAGVAFTNTSTFPGGGSIIRYSWNFADGSPLVSTINATHTFTSARTYNVVLKVTSDSGCTQILTQPIIVHPRPVLTKSNDTTVCPGFSTPIWVRGGSVYIWSPGATLSDSLISNPIASPPNVPVTYRVIVADTNRCQSFDSVKVKFWRLQPIDAGMDTSICFAAGSYHDSVQLHATGGVSYRWIFDSTTLSNSYVSNPWARPRVNTYYQVLVTDFHGCVQQDSVQVVVLDPAIDIITQTDTGMCQYDTISLNVADQGAITRYLWTPSTGVSNPNIRSPYFYPTDSGMYYVNIRNYCYTKTDSVQINVYPLPVINTGKVDSICIGDTFHIQTGGTVSYTWRPDPTLTPWNTPDPLAFPISDHWYYVTGVDTLGCRNTDSFLLKVFLKPNAQILAPPKIICFGTPVQVTATGGVRYLWSYGWTMNDSTIADPMITPPDTTTYWVRVTNEHNCSNYDSVRLNVQMPVTAYAAPDSEICRKQELPLHAWGGLYYLWTPSTALSSSIVPNPYSRPDSTITYNVHVSNDCFSDDTTLTVHIHQLPPANAGPDDTIYRNQSTTLTGSGGVSYTWYPNIGLNDPSNYTTVASPYNTQQYILWVTDDFGCVNTDTVVVNVVVNTLILIPTAFSPNGDGTNDIFRIAKWLNLDKVLEFSVWNRWGEKIWETNDKNGGWDGTFNGRPEPMAVYVWQLKGTDFDGNTLVRSGTVTLLR